MASDKATSASAVLGKREEALRIMESAFRALDKTDDRAFEAEAYRIRGDILAGRSAGTDPQGAQSNFEKAISIAQCQQAKSLELRTAVSWARLLITQGSESRAQERLSPLLSWFSETFGTPDLVEARTLLERAS